MLSCARTLQQTQDHTLQALQNPLLIKFTSNMLTTVPKAKAEETAEKGEKAEEVPKKPSETEQITILQEQQKKDRARLMCPNEKHDGGCRKHKYKTCAYKHSDSKETPAATTPTTTRKPEKSQTTTAKGGGKSVSLRSRKVLCFRRDWFMSTRHHVQIQSRDQHAYSCDERA